jgi:hypothetical protein
VEQTQQDMEIPEEMHLQMGVLAVVVLGEQVVLVDLAQVVWEGNIY